MTSIVLRVGEVELADTSDPDLVRRVAEHLLRTTRPTAVDPAERAMENGRTQALKAIVRTNQQPRYYTRPRLRVLNETA
jgi:hypothetical protein